MKGALHLLFPPQCLGCDAAVAEAGLCAACWGECDFITGAACCKCGMTLPGDAEAADLLCDPCMTYLRPWDQGVAALTYGGTARKMVLALKHGDRPALAVDLGRWLAQRAMPLLRPGMIVVPIPIHPRRLLRRKYNQAALIAAEVARLCDLVHRPAVLRRTRYTPMQENADMTLRFVNLDGAIGVAPRYNEAIRGQDVLLIDDVMTSGATLAAASTALIAAGAGQISVAVVARAMGQSHKDGVATAAGDA